MAGTLTGRPTPHPFTRAEYHRMAEAGIFDEDDRVELIEGTIIDMTPVGSRHAGTVNHVNTALVRALGNRALVATQNPIVLDDHSEPQPDIALLKPRADFYRNAHATAADVFALIEVAEASPAFDRDVKLPLYARHGVPEAWLVDLDGERLLRYRQPSPEGYRQALPTESLDAVPLPEAIGGTVDLAELFGPNE